MNINIDDTSEYQISENFKKCYDFINEVLGNDKESIDLLIDELENNKVFTNNKYLVRMKTLNINNFKDLIDKIDNMAFHDKILQKLFKECLLNDTCNRVLIHCSMGVSRSPSMAIMYLMKKLKLPFEYVIDIN